MGQYFLWRPKLFFLPWLPSSQCPDYIRGMASKHSTDQDCQGLSYSTFHGDYITPRLTEFTKLPKPRSIAILCAHPKSHYFEIEGLEVYDQKRDARNFVGNAPVICHPPCAQWSRLRKFAKVDLEQKALANFCLGWFASNGGIFEHPAGSSVFRELEFPKESKMYSVDQSWWGFPARKRTYLVFHRCSPIAYPLNFDLITHTVTNPKGGMKELSKNRVALTPLSFDQWLVDSIRATFK